MTKYEISRRSVLLSGASFLGTMGLGIGVRAEDEASLALNFSETQRYSLQEALKSADEIYDPNAKMITSSVSGVGYHTTLRDQTVHSTRTSLEYAVALLDSGEEKRLERAKDILQTVIALQDQNPENRTYGIWSWYLEEPLEKMSPPDWNWADFCGALLLAAWIDHRDRLGEELADAVRDSIVHACNSIKKRNVSLSYTNIAIMGTYVTLTASDRFELKEMQTYAKDRLRRYHAYVFEQQSFAEYNSPTYSVVAIRELARMFMHVRDEEDLKLIREIHDFAWKHAACRFHEPTRQWAGPHSRCYSTLLRDKTKTFLETATGEKGWVTDRRPLKLGLGDYRIPTHCPDSCNTYFSPLKEPRTVTEMFNRQSIPAYSIIGTTYLHPHYTLGTVNRADFWNQRRAFVAYWGEPDRPTYLHLRVLHDGYDFCSALPFTLQHKGVALTSVAFATDYGDAHPSLDRVKNATIRAKDLRLRFEFGGRIDGLKFMPINGPEGILFLSDRNVQFQVRPLIDLFVDGRFRWEIGQNKEIAWIDAVAYSGEEKEINFSKLERAFLAFSMQICSVDEKQIPMDNIQIREKDGWRQIDWSFVDPNDSRQQKEVQFHLEAPEKPDKRKALYTALQKIFKLADY